MELSFPRYMIFNHNLLFDLENPKLCKESLNELYSLRLLKKDPHITEQDIKYGLLLVKLARYYQISYAELMQTRPPVFKKLNHDLFQVKPESISQNQ